MVIFEQNHIEKPDTMVHATAQRYCFFFQITESRRGLTSIQYMASGVFNQGLILMCGCSHAGHSLHNIKHRALNLQETQLLAIDFECDISRLHMVTIVEKLLKLTLRIKVIDNLFRHLDSCKHTRIFDYELLATHLGRRNTTERSMIAVTDILFKPDSDKLTKFFFVHSFFEFMPQNYTFFCIYARKIVNLQPKTVKTCFYEP